MPSESFYVSRTQAQAKRDEMGDKMLALVERSGLGSTALGVRFGVRRDTAAALIKEARKRREARQLRA